MLLLAFFTVRSLKDSDQVPCHTISVAFFTGRTFHLSLCSDMPHTSCHVVIYTSRVVPGQMVIPLLGRYHLSLSYRFSILTIDVNMWMFFLVLCSHYVSSYCDHYHSTHDCYVLQNIAHHC